MVTATSALDLPETRQSIQLEKLSIQWPVLRTGASRPALASIGILRALGAKRDGVDLPTCT